MKLTLLIKFYQMKILKNSMIILDMMFIRQMLQMETQVQDRTILITKESHLIVLVVEVISKVILEMEMTCLIPFLTIFLTLKIKIIQKGLGLIIPITITRNIHQMTITIIEVILISQLLYIKEMLFQMDKLFS